MSNITLLTPARPLLSRRIVVFSLVGLSGTVVDAAVTTGLVHAFAMSPLAARPPAFLLATICNFILNRRYTFQDATTPWRQAFARYCAVCAGGLVVNYLVFAVALALAAMIGFVVPDSALPAFVATGSGAAMTLTYLGFRSFAFGRPAQRQGGGAN